MRFLIRVLLKAKRVALYLYGNSENISVLGLIASFYLKCGLMCWSVGYLGFGKSSGQVRNEQEWYDDMQQVYVYVKNAIVGFSMGADLAAKLVANNHSED